MSLSSNMGMPIPSVSVTSGPQYAANLNASFNIVDAHDHSPGSGVLITPSGININADVDFNATNSILNIKMLDFTSQVSALTGLNFLSFVGGNLYVNDGSGNQIPITASGGVAGSPGSIGSLTAPAAATYSSGNKQFTWTSGSNKAAAMDNGAITIRETDVASAFGITLQSPSGLGADYDLILPSALPGTTQLFNVDSAGNMGTISYDAAAAAMSATGANAIGALMTSTGANAVANSRTRALGTSVAAGGVAKTSPSGTFSTASTTYVDITNLSVTITTTGRPICLKVISNQTALQQSGIRASVQPGFLRYLRDSTSINEFQIDLFTSNFFTPVFDFVDDNAGAGLPAGTYVYHIQAKTTSGGGLQAYQLSLVAYEL